MSKKLLNLALAAPLALAGLTAVSTVPAKAANLGTVDIAGQVDFPNPGPPQFSFRPPAACLLPGTGCDFTVTDATGVLAPLELTPLSPGYKFDLPTFIGGLPSIVLPAKGNTFQPAADSACAIPVTPNNTVAPNFKCSGNPSFPALGQQITQTLIPVVGEKIPFLWLDNVAPFPGSPPPYYRVFIKEIQSFAVQPLSATTSQTAIAALLHWELIDSANGNTFFSGDGSLNATYQNTATSTSYSAQLVLGMPKAVPEPSSVLGLLAVASGVGALSLKKKIQSK